MRWTRSNTELGRAAVDGGSTLSDRQREVLDLPSQAFPRATYQDAERFRRRRQRCEATCLASTPSSEWGHISSLAQIGTAAFRIKQATRKHAPSLDAKPGVPTAQLPTRDPCPRPVGGEHQRGLSRLGFGRTFRRRRTLPDCVSTALRDRPVASLRSPRRHALRRNARRPAVPGGRTRRKQPKRSRWRRSPDSDRVERLFTAVDALATSLAMLATSLAPVGTPRAGRDAGDTRAPTPAAGSTHRVGASAREHPQADRRTHRGLATHRAAAPSAPRRAMARRPSRLRAHEDVRRRHGWRRDGTTSLVPTLAGPAGPVRRAPVRRAEPHLGARRGAGRTATCPPAARSSRGYWPSFSCAIVG